MTYNIWEILQNFIVLFAAITVHEYAHGLIAYKLGDPTAKAMGRLTLNPLSHLDPLGSIMFIFCGLGWAKPVPVNPYYFEEPKKDMVLVSVAGPLSNLVLAFVAATVSPFVIFALRMVNLPAQLSLFIIQLLYNFTALNICFAVFNLIPFPPLDGSKILFSVLPNDAYNTLLTYERYGTIIILLLSFTGLLGDILGVIINPIYNLYFAYSEFLFSLIS